MCAVASADDTDTDTDVPLAPVVDTDVRVDLGDPQSVSDPSEAPPAIFVVPVVRVEHPACVLLDPSVSLVPQHIEQLQQAQTSADVVTVQNQIIDAQEQKVDDLTRELLLLEQQVEQIKKDDATAGAVGAADASGR